METQLHPSDSLREDLHYLRSALERQQQLHRRLLSLPAAIILGLYILALCARRDLAPNWQSPIFDLVGYAVLIALATVPWLQTDRQGEVPRCGAVDVARLLLPWAGLGVAMILLYQMANRLALPAEAVSPLLILLIALTAFVAGLGGFPMLLSVGLGLGAGLEIRLLWPQSGWLVFGAVVCAGLIGGALVERRRAKSNS